MEKVEKKEGVENRGRSGKKIMRRKGVRENKRTEGRTRKYKISDEVKEE